MNGFLWCWFSLCSVCVVSFLLVLVLFENSMVVLVWVLCLIMLYMCCIVLLWLISVLKWLRWCSDVCSDCILLISLYGWGICVSRLCRCGMLIGLSR